LRHRRGHRRQIGEIYPRRLRSGLILVGGFEIFRDAVHPKNIHIRGFPARLGERHLVDGFLVDLIAMDDQAARGAELLSTQIALEMLCFLVLDENLLILEHAIAVVTPRLHDFFLLLFPHALPKCRLDHTDKRLSTDF